MSRSLLVLVRVHVCYTSYTGSHILQLLSLKMGFGLVFLFFFVSDLYILGFVGGL